jgi:hypothetical protein
MSSNFSTWKRDTQGHKDQAGRQTRTDDDQSIGVESQLPSPTMKRLQLSTAGSPSALSVTRSTIKRGVGNGRGPGAGSQSTVLWRRWLTRF